MERSIHDAEVVGMKEVQAATEDGRLILGTVRVDADGTLYLDTGEPIADERAAAPEGSFAADEEVGPGA